MLKGEQEKNPASCLYRKPAQRVLHCCVYDSAQRAAPLVTGLAPEKGAAIASEPGTAVLR